MAHRESRQSPGGAGAAPHRMVTPIFIAIVAIATTVVACDSSTAPPGSPQTAAASASLAIETPLSAATPLARPAATASTSASQRTGAPSASAAAAPADADVAVLATRVEPSLDGR